MAATTATLTVYNYPNGINNTQRRQTLYGTIAIGASPLTYATGGIQLSFLGVKDASGQVVQIDSASTLPAILWLQGVGGSGYTYTWNQPTNKLQIFTVDATATGTEYPLIEFTNGAAIPAGVSGDTIVFEADFIRANG
jgi:hypothetical protein